MDHVEHEAVTRAVHGLESMFFIIVLDEEDILFVLEIVATTLPQIRAVYVGRYDFTVAPNLVLGSHEVEKFIVNDCAVWEKHCTSSSHGVKME